MNHQRLKIPTNFAGYWEPGSLILSVSSLYKLGQLVYSSLEGSQIDESSLSAHTWRTYWRPHCLYHIDALF